MSLSVTEFVPPDRWHSVLEFRPSSTSDLERIEMIQAGGKRFVKKGSGEWIWSSAGDGGGAGRAAAGAKPDESFDCTYLGTEMFGGIAVDVYQKVRTMRQRTTKTFWFDKKGLLVKEDHYFDNAVNSVPRYRLVWEYEYDPTIRIEEPVMTKGLDRPMPSKPTE